MTLILQIPAGIHKPKHQPDIWTFWSSWLKLLRCCIYWVVTTEMYISGLRIHQGTQWVPRNTVTEQIYHITIRNLGIASVSGSEKSWSQPISRFWLQTWCWSQHAGAVSGERSPKAITTLGGSGGMPHREFFVSEKGGLKQHSFSAV